MADKVLASGSVTLSADATAKAQEVNQNLDGYMEEVDAALETKAAADAIAEINKLVNTYLGDSGYIKITEDNSLEIGKGRFKTVLASNKLAFYEDGEEVAYISDEKLLIEKSQTIQEQRMGSFVWTIRDGGRLTLKHSPEEPAAEVRTWQQ